MATRFLGVCKCFSVNLIRCLLKSIFDRFSACTDIFPEISGKRNIALGLKRCALLLIRILVGGAGDDNPSLCLGRHQTGEKTSGITRVIDENQFASHNSLQFI